MKTIIKKISDDLNISKSTISKALNHCPGVDNETRERIAKIACDLGYRRDFNTKIGIVLPCIPTYFWKRLHTEIQKGLRSKRLDYASFLYSSLGCVNDAINCINDAIKAGICVLIIAAPVNDAVKNKLMEYSDDMLIILVTQYIDIKNTFFVGENSYKNAYDLGKEYIKKYPSSSSFINIGMSSNETINQRISGFSAALNEYGHTMTSVNINFNYREKICSALIARELAKIKKIDCVFSPDGVCEYVCEAVRKLKSDHEIHCIGFENSPKSEHFSKIGILKMISMQDIESQAKIICGFVENYINGYTFPNGKLNLTDNIIL